MDLRVGVFCFFADIGRAVGSLSFGVSGVVLPWERARPRDQLGLARPDLAGPCSVLPGRIGSSCLGERTGFARPGFSAQLNMAGSTWLGQVGLVALVGH